ncbi:hypothetical protein VTL71DRAFT_14292 [Oculimacula yallundae]|uniref:Secreted protein n=1 Tax=Oculimacula yallundae TaxID=86028 RepID=A0ABR4CI65_9HELO
MSLASFSSSICFSATFFLVSHHCVRGTAWPKHGLAFFDTCIFLPSPVGKACCLVRKRRLAGANLRPALAVRVFLFDTESLDFSPELIPGIDLSAALARTEVSVAPALIVHGVLR